MKSNIRSFRTTSLAIFSIIFLTFFASSVLAHNWTTYFVTPASWTGVYNASVDVEDDSTLIIQSSGWSTVNDAGYSGGTAIGTLATVDSVSTAELKFSGLAIDWHTKMGPDQGVAKVYIDGSLDATFDLFATSDTFGVAFSKSFLFLDWHTIMIEAATNGDANNNNDNVSVDKFVYLNSNDRPVAVDRVKITTADATGTYDVFSGHYLTKPRINDNGRVVYEYHTGATHSQTTSCPDIGGEKVEIHSTQIFDTNNVGLDVQDFLTPASSQNGIHVPNRLPSVYGDLVVWQSGINAFNNDCNSDLYSTNTNTGSSSLIETAAGAQINTTINQNKIAYQSKMRRSIPQLTQSDWDIYYIDLSVGSSRIPLSISNIAFDQIQPSVDGNVLAFSDNSSGVYNVYLYHTVTKQMKKVSSSPCDQVEPSISGGILVWQEYACTSADPNWEIMGAKVSTGNMKKFNLTNNVSDQFHPRTDGDTVVWEDWRNDDDGTWSNGQEFGFHKNKDNPDIYMLDISLVNGGNISSISSLTHQVTSGLTPEINPDVSANLVVFEKVETASIDYSMDPPDFDCKFYPVGSGDIDPGQANYSKNCLYPNAIYMKDITTFTTARNS